MHRAFFVAGIFIFLVYGLSLPAKQSMTYAMITIACLAAIIAPQTFMPEVDEKLSADGARHLLLVRNFAFGAAWGAVASTVQTFLYDAAPGTSLSLKLVNAAFPLALVLIVVIAEFRDIGNDEDAKEKRWRGSAHRP